MADLRALSQEADPPKRVELIKKILASFHDRFEFPEIDSPSLRESIWAKCFEGLESSPADSPVILDLIRVLSREKVHLDVIFGENPLYIERLVKLAKLSNASYEMIRDDELAVVEAALKGLGNIGKQSMVGLSAFCDKETIRALVTRLDAVVPASVRSLDVRLLFLATALKPSLRQFVRLDCRGLAVLERILEKAVARGDLASEEIGDRAPFGPLDLHSKPRCLLSDEDTDLICDVLKLLYNLTLTWESVDEEKYVIDRLVVLIRRLLLSSPKDNPMKKKPLVANIMNLLTTVPPSCFEKVIEPVEERGARSVRAEKRENDQDAMRPIAVLLALLDMLLSEMDEANVFEALFPTLLGMSRMAKANSTIRRYLRQQVLPRLNKPDIMKKPEEGTKLRNKLVRLLTHPSIELKEASATFLFVLCKENVGRMVKYTGFGNAAGMLSLRGLMGGAPSEGAADYSPDSDSDSDTEDYKDLAGNINPVTGCYEAPRPSAVDEMTDEQKEVEAIRLVNLIDRMNRQGCIQPVRIGRDGRVHAIEHVLELQEGIDPTKTQQNGAESSDED